MRRMIKTGMRRAIVAGFVAAATFLASGRSEAQLIEAAATVKQGYDFVKGAYDAYKSGRDFLNPEPSTADLIAAAVENLSNLFVNSEAAPVLGDALTAIKEYQTAIQGGPSNPDLKTFDADALRVLNRIRGYLTIPNDPRYAHILAPVYNSLLPLYLANHLAGRAWGSQASQASLEAEFIYLAKDALQLNYNMIGGKIVGHPGLVDSTPTSQLRQWVTSTSGGVNPIATTTALGDAYFQTDPSVQAVQRAAAALFTMIQESGGDPSVLYDSPHVTSVVVDPSGWTDNWRGAADGVWTAIQPYVDNVEATTAFCPTDFAMIAVRQMQFGLAGYLCTPIPGIPAMSPSTVSFYTRVDYSCSTSFCSYLTQCPADQIAVSAVFSTLQCLSRTESGLSTLPPLGPVSAADLSFSPMSPGGAYYDLPAGTVLTGIDPTDFAHNNYTYFYAQLYTAAMSFSIWSAIN
jgi:hypothetical protein